METPVMNKNLITSLVKKLSIATAIYLVTISLTYFNVIPAFRICGKGGSCYEYFGLPYGTIIVKSNGVEEMTINLLSIPSDIFLWYILVSVLMWLFESQKKVKKK